MADISMCKNQLCPSNKSCYRFTAEANSHRQTYSSFIPNIGEDKCDYYWNNYGGKEKKDYKDE